MKMHHLPAKAVISLLLAFSFTACKDKPEEAVAPGATPAPASAFTVEEAFPGRTGEIKDGQLFGHPIQYTEIDNQAVFEGDIILTPADLGSADQGGRTSGAGRRLSAYRWPNNIVYYTIDPALPNQARVTDAIAHWQAKTPLRFFVRPNEQQLNYITFRPGSGCSSSIGMVGGQQFINLASSCSTGSTIHEIAHAVGFWHEQSRADRNGSIKINFANIIPGKEHNFQTYIQKGADGFDYNTFDFGSIMMYSPYAFSSNNLPTITKLDGSTYTVQRDGLSVRDVSTAVSMYANLYAVRNDRLYGIHAGTGQRTDLGNQWQGTEALASANNALYGVQVDHLWKTDRLNGKYTSLGANYAGTLDMEPLSGSLYLVQVGSLWRVNPTTGAYVKVGTINWNGTTAMAALGGYLYIVRGDVLYRVNPTTGGAVSLGGLYSGTTEMAALNGSLYTIQLNSLWRINPSTGAYMKVGTANWSGTTAMTTFNGYLYVVQGDVLYRVAGSGAWKALSPGWSGTQEMTAIANL
jgi:hypothetical protein